MVLAGLKCKTPSDTATIARIIATIPTNVVMPWAKEIDCSGCLWFCLSARWSSVRLEVVVVTVDSGLGAADIVIAEPHTRVSWPGRMRGVRPVVRA